LNTNEGKSERGRGRSRQRPALSTICHNAMVASFIFVLLFYFFLNIFLRNIYHHLKGSYCFVLKRVAHYYNLFVCVCVYVSVLLSPPSKEI